MNEERKVYFKNSKGDKLRGIIVNPSGNNSNPIIILCHGFSTSKNSGTYLALKDRLSRHNISTFRFDFYGHGESEGKFEDITISEAVDDILQAIEFLVSEDFKNIGLMGSSFGGIASIMAASKTNRLFTLALKSPVSNYTNNEIETKSEAELLDWKKKGYRYYESGDGRKLRLNYTFYEDFKNNDGYKAAPKIMVPTLIVHGDADEIVPFKQSVKTSKLIPDCKLHPVKGANHHYDGPGHAEEMLQALEGFIFEKSKLFMQS